MARLLPDPRSTIMGGIGASGLGSAVSAVSNLASNPGAAVGRAAQMLKTSAAARLSSMVAQKLSPTSVRKIQQLLQATSFVSGIAGDGLQDAQQPLLGGMTLRDARETYEQLRDAQLARKNLFFVRVIDYNPPPVEYADGMYFTSLFNLFALDVSYSPNTLTGEKVPLGSAVMDKLTGTEHSEMSITTMDDSRGSLKRWFEAKTSQAAHADGTFGVPAEYWLDIEVYHATPQARDDAYKYSMRMRTQNIQHELSRRDQAMTEMAMTFTQFDTFLSP